MQSARASEIASICYIRSVRITEGSAHPNIHRYPQIYAHCRGLHRITFFFPQLRSGQQQLYTSLQNCLWNVWGDVPKLQLDIGRDPMSMSFYQFYHAWFPRSRFHFLRKLCPSSQDGIKLAKLLCWQGTIRRTLWQSTLATIDCLSPSTVDFPFATTCWKMDNFLAIFHCQRILGFLDGMRHSLTGFHLSLPRRPQRHEKADFHLPRKQSHESGKKWWTNIIKYYG